MAGSATDLSEVPGHLRARGKTRAAIVDAARALASEDGAGAVSFKAVAERCDMAPGAVYPFFRTKSELLQAVVADDMDGFFRAFRRAIGLPEPPPRKPATPTRIVRFELPPVELAKTEEPERPASAEPMREIANGHGNERFSDPLAERLEEIGFGDVRAIVTGFESNAAKANERDESADVWANSEPDDVYGLLTLPVTEPRAEPKAEPIRESKEKREEPAAPHAARDETAAPASDAPVPDRKAPAKSGRITLIGKKSVVTADLEETAQRIAPLESAADSIARLEETVAKLESGNWDRFERRLHIIESALAGLEKRYEVTDLTSKTAQSAAQECTDAIKKFAERLDVVEKRQGDMLMKTTAQLKDATRRLDDSEPARFGANATVLEPAPDMGDPPLPAASEPASEPKSPASASPLESATGDDARPSDPAKPQNYLSAARKSAMTASDIALASGKEEEDRKSRRARMLLGAAIGLAGVLVVVTLVLNGIFSSKPVSPVVAQHSVVPKRIRAMHATAMAPLDFLTSLAKAGNDKAELIVGLKYLSGDGVAKSETDAAQWVSRAAQKGNAVAEYVLATLYQAGRGVTADPAQGASWYEKAAMQGNRKAMHNLAVAYAEGKGVPQDYSEAARWFSRAADLGYVDSAFNLAVLYERGDGVPQSLLDAYKWYSVAGAAGDVESKTRLSALETQLSADDLAAAQATAASFKPQEYVPDTNDTPKLSDLTDGK